MVFRDRVDAGQRIAAEAALVALRRARPRRLVLAVPVCARETADRLARLADEVVRAEAPRQFYAVGQWYEDFSQTTDEEVMDVLARFHPVSEEVRRRAG